MTDNFDMKDVTTDGKVRRAVITVRNVNQGSFATTVLFYDDIVSAYADTDSVLSALGLDKTIIDTIAEYRLPQYVLSVGEI